MNDCSCVSLQLALAVLLNATDAGRPPASRSNFAAS